MNGDDVLVDVRIRVRSSVYRHLFAEAQRRRLAGAGELVELMLHRQPMPRRSIGRPPAERRPIPAELVPDIIERVLDRGESVRGLAAELGVTRGAIYHYTRPAKEAREAAAAAAAHAAHAPALDELGVVGRPPIPDATVPST